MVPDLPGSQLPVLALGDAAWAERLGSAARRDEAMMQRPFVLNPGDDREIVDLRMRAERLERLCGEIVAEVSDLRRLATNLAARDPAEPKALLSVEECAGMLGLSRTTTFALVRAGQLPSIKVGARRLVRRTDLEGFVSMSEETMTSRAG